MSERMYYSTEAELRARREKLMLVLVVTGLSVSITTIIALLLAPQSGDKTREQLGEQVSSSVAKGLNKATAAGEQLRESADKVLENVNGRIEAVRE